LVDAGVDFEAEVDPRAPTGLYVKDPYGRAVHYYRRGSAASFMGRDMLTGLSGARVLHLSGITAALSDSCADLMRHALVDRPHPAVVSFDVNYRAGLWSAADAAPVLAELANAADLVFVGRDEAEVLWGTVIADKIRAVLSQPRTLIVKDGGVGATAYVADHARVFAPAPPVDIVEPVGAGDAFAAGYLYGLLRDAPMAARLRLGHLVAGCAMRSAGDVGTPPSPAEISQALNSDD
ncbi:MAG: sugar kinase, partial [Stackebrandtia sp.]